MASNLENYKLEGIFIQDQKTKAEIEEAFKIIIGIIADVKAQLSDEIQLSKTSLNDKIAGTSIVKTGGAATDVLRADGSVTTGLSGTKVYYVSDSSGGAVTRKLTFVNGLLTSET